MSCTSFLFLFCTLNHSRELGSVPAPDHTSFLCLLHRTTLVMQENNIKMSPAESRSVAQAGLTNSCWNSEQNPSSMGQHSWM